MSNSLRSKLSKLRYKRQISDEEYKELTDKLRGHDKELLDKIRSEIEEYKSRQLTLAIGVADLEEGKQIAIEYILAIIDKYKAESEDKV